MASYKEILDRLKIGEDVWDNTLFICIKRKDLDKERGTFTVSESRKLSDEEVLKFTWIFVEYLLKNGIACITNGEREIFLKMIKKDVKQR